MPSYEQETNDRSGHALLRAIREARQAVSQQIEECRAMLAACDAAGEGDEPSLVSPGPGVESGAEPPGVVDPEPRPRRIPARHAAVTSAEEALASPPAPGDDPPPAAVAPARSDDARQRRDAHARLLDKRARQSSGDAPGRSGTPEKGCHGTTRSPV